LSKKKEKKKSWPHDVINNFFLLSLNSIRKISFWSHGRCSFIAQNIKRRHTTWRTIAFFPLILLCSVDWFLFIFCVLCLFMISFSFDSSFFLSFKFVYFFGNLRCCSHCLSALFFTFYLKSFDGINKLLFLLAQAGIFLLCP
jgi:hypothetical protein